MNDQLPTAHDTIAFLRTSVQPVLGLLGVTRVVSIDDDHQKSDLAGDVGVPDVIAALNSGDLDVGSLLDDPALREFLEVEGAVMSVDELSEQIRAGIEDDILERLVAVVLQKSEGKTGHDAVNDVSSVILLAGVFDDFEGLDYARYNLDEWRTTGISSLSQTQVPQLVMVDRDFSRDDGAIDEGEKIVASILNTTSRSDVLCCLVTHSVNNREQAEQLQQQITDQYKLPAHAVIVLGKAELHATPIQFAFRLLSVLLSSQLESIRDDLAQALSQANDAARAALESLTSYQMLGMFRSAEHEGLHEPDHAMRPLSAAARRAAVRALRSSGNTAIAIEKLRDALGIEGVDSVVRAEDVSQFRQDEFLDSGAFLRETWQPIDTGDIFELVNYQDGNDGAYTGTGNYLVLLSQPCDIMVRGNGKRGANSPFYVTLASVRDEKHSDPRRSRVNLATFIDGIPRIVDLAQTFHFPLMALDLCVFGNDGVSRMSLGDQCEPTVPLSWARRHVILKAEVLKLSEIARCAKMHEFEDSRVAKAMLAGLVGMHAPNTSPLGRKQQLGVRMSPDYSSLAFGIRRVGRLNDSTTRALLIHDNQNQGRPADMADLFR